MTEKRLDLIDRQTLLWEFKTNAKYHAHVASLAQCIHDVPTVDAVEVAHGVWCIDDYDSGDPGYYSAYIEVHCSKCGYELGAESGQYGWVYGDPFPLNFCPNCGAKMDGGAEDGG